MRTITSHLNFDLDLARKQSDDNPVFYLQYAHARIASILRKADEEGLSFSGSKPPVDLLASPSELDLIKKLLLFPELVESCAHTHEPHRLAEYLHVIAGLFHRFYHECRVMSSDSRLTNARLALCTATKVVLRNGLVVLGISVPDSM
jgi:arginyl-tRNA synthetase